MTDKRVLLLSPSFSLHLWLPVYSLLYAAFSFFFFSPPAIAVCSNSEKFKKKSSKKLKALPSIHVFIVIMPLFLVLFVSCFE